MLIGKYIKEERGFNKYLIEAVKLIKKRFGVSWDVALYLLIFKYSEVVNLLSEEERKEIVENIKQYLRMTAESLKLKTLRMENQLRKEVIQKQRFESSKLQLERIIKSHYRRLKEYYNVIDVLKLLKQFYLDDDYLKAFDLDKKEVKALIVKILKEEDYQVYKELKELKRGGKGD